MRTKTLALSALLGALSSASLIAQTNVYSLNAVGYVNVTMPHGFSLITDPLYATPNNHLNNTLNNANGQYSGASVYQFQNGVGFTNIENGNPFGSGWLGGGEDISLDPGVGVFFYNPNSDPMTATFVGTVPTGSLTNVLVPGFNLLGSMVPVAGDLITNSVTAFSVANSGDIVYFFDPVAQAYGPNLPSYAFGNWSSDPITTSVSEGFFYYNAGAGGTEYWVEQFSINP